LNKQQIANLEQQLETQKKLTQIAERRAEVEHIAYERQKELTDRAIKLAEIGKPKSNWQFQGLLGAAAFAIGLLIRR
jgi:predicted phage tail protein